MRIAIPRGERRLHTQTVSSFNSSPLAPFCKRRTGDWTRAGYGYGPPVFDVICLNPNSSHFRTHPVPRGQFFVSKMSKQMSEIVFYRGRIPADSRVSTTAKKRYSIGKIPFQTLLKCFEQGSRHLPEPKPECSVRRTSHDLSETGQIMICLEQRIKEDSRIRWFKKHATCDHGVREAEPQPLRYSACLGARRCREQTWRREAKMM